MSKIYNRFMYEDDELLFSWITRLSDANCFDNNIDFLSYVTGNGCKNQTMLHYDVREYILPLLNDIDSDNPIKNYLSTSVYPFEAMFDSKMNLGRRFSYCFSDYTDHEDLIIESRGAERIRIRFCPECMKEDMEKLGYIYVHRSHVLPEVKTCYKHNTRLMEFMGSHLKSLNDTSAIISGLKYVDEPKGNPSGKGKNFNRHYAKFAHDLMRLNNSSGFSMSISDIISIISRGISRKQTTLDYNNPYTDYCRSLIDRGITSHMVMKDTGRKSSQTREKRQLDYLVRGLNGQTIMNPKNYIILLMDLYEDVNSVYREFMKTNPKYAEESTTRIISEKGYTVLNQYGCSIMKLIHNGCPDAKTFYATIPYFLAGWQCPECRKRMTSEQVIEHMIDESGNHEYIIDNLKKAPDNRTIDNTYTLKRINDNTILETTFRRFVIERKRNTPVMPASQYEAEIKLKKRNRYKLISYTNNKSQARIKDEKCGYIFDTDYRKFITTPTCPFCRRMNIKNREELEKRIYEAVGDEYRLEEILGDESNIRNLDKIKVRHKLCGKVSTLVIYDFLRGLRCSCSRVQMTFNEFRSYVNEVSYGRYECQDEEFISGRALTILDNDTGNIFRGSKSYIIQELTRPAETSILPLRKRNPDVFPDSKPASRLLNFILKTYEPESIISYDDVIRDISEKNNPERSNFDRKTVMASMKKLANKNILAEIENGKFMLNNSFSDVEEMNDKVLKLKNESLK